MNKITSIIIDSTNKKYFVSYETGNSKMYLEGNLPKTVINYLNSETAKVNYTTKATEAEQAEAVQEQEQETTTEAEAITAEATATASEQTEAEQETATATAEASAILETVTEATAEAEQAEAKEQTAEASEQRRKTAEASEADAEAEASEQETATATTSEAEAEQAETIEHKIIKIRSNFFIACNVVNKKLPSIVTEYFNKQNSRNNNSDIFTSATAIASEQAKQLKKTMETETAKTSAYTKAIEAKAEAENRKLTKAEAEAIKQRIKEQTKAIAEQAKATATAEAETRRSYSNNSSFEEVKANFYKAYKAFKAVTAIVTATAKAKAEASEQYAKAINDICMILVLSVLKKIANVSRTGKTAKTKHDTNYYTIFNIRNDLISSNNALNNLMYAVNNSDSFRSYEINTLFKKSFASDGIELLATAKHALLENIAKAEAETIAVNTDTDDFLDTIYTYTDINKKIWVDIQTATNIKSVDIQTATEQQKLLLSEEIYKKQLKKAEATAETAEAIAEKIHTVYTVTYNGSIKQYTNYNVPKTVIAFIEHETALKNNSYDKEKNLYLVSRETCIAKEVFSAIRSYIQNEKATTTNNSYCYIADVTTITDNTGTAHTFETYRRIPKENNALIYNIDKVLAVKEAEVDRITDFIKSLSLSDSYKLTYSEMIKNIGYRTIAKKHNLNENTVKSQTRSIRDKILTKSILGNRQKYKVLKKNIMDINKQLKEASASEAKASATASEASAIVAHVKQLKLQQNRLKNKTYTLKAFTIGNTTTKKISSINNNIAVFPVAVYKLSTLAKQAKAEAIEATAKAEAEAKKIFDLKEAKAEASEMIKNVCTEALHNSKTAIEAENNIIYTEASAEAKKAIEAVYVYDSKTKDLINIAEASEASAEQNIIYTVIYNTEYAKQLNRRTATAEETAKAEAIAEASATAKNEADYKKIVTAVKTLISCTKNIDILKQTAEQAEATAKKAEHTKNAKIKAYSNSFRKLAEEATAKASTLFVTYSYNKNNVPVTVLDYISYKTAEAKKKAIINDNKMFLNTLKQYTTNTSFVDKMVYTEEVTKDKYFNNFVYIAQNTFNIPTATIKPKAVFVVKDKQTAEASIVNCRYTEHAKNIYSKTNLYLDNFETVYYSLTMYNATATPTAEATTATAEAIAEAVTGTATEQQYRKYNITVSSLAYTAEYNAKIITGYYRRTGTTKFKNIFTVPVFSKTAYKAPTESALTKLDKAFFEAMKAEAKRTATASAK